MGIGHVTHSLRVGNVNCLVQILDANITPMGVGGSGFRVWGSTDPTTTSHKYAAAARRARI